MTRRSTLFAVFAFALLAVLGSVWLSIAHWTSRAPERLSSTSAQLQHHRLSRVEGPTGERRLSGRYTALSRTSGIRSKGSIDEVPGIRSYLFPSAFSAALALADDHGTTMLSGMTGGGMMGGGMEGCTQMMQGRSGTRRPNEQWRQH